jgi:Cupin domain
VFFGILPETRPRRQSVNGGRQGFDFGFPDRGWRARLIPPLNGKLDSVNQPVFEAELRRDGYGDVVTVHFEAGHEPGEHAHPYDVRALILEGEFTIAANGQVRRYRPGEVLELAAGCRHTERTGADGVRFLAGRRKPNAIAN